MQKILVATDFSNEAYNALFYVTRLFEGQRCTFYILNVFNEQTPLQKDSVHLLNEEKKINLLERESLELLSQTVHRINLDHKSTLHEFETLSKQGVLSSILGQTMESLMVDLLVMGNKGKTGVKEIFMGSNTTKIAHNLKQCPLLAIPKEIEFKLPKEIVFITDLKKGCTLKTLGPILSLANFLKASIQVLHIEEEEILTSLQASNKKLLEISLKDIAHRFSSIYGFSDKAKVIDSFLKKREVRMFSMVYSKTSFIESFFKEPVIMDLSMYTNVPFLILPNRE